MSRRRLRVALAALVAVGPLVVGGASAGAGAAGPCPGPGGVTVVVDFGSLGGGTVVRCADSDPGDSGFDVLRAAGLEVRTLATQPGFLCRIDRRPASDPCLATPPADAYWSYWHAPRGGEWTYSDVGGASRTPPPGSVEGWAFATGPDGAAGPPRISPPARPSPTTTAPRRTTTASPGPTVAAPSPTAAAEAPSPEPGSTAAPPGGSPDATRPNGPSVAASPTTAAPPATTSSTSVPPAEVEASGATGDDGRIELDVQAAAAGGDGADDTGADATLVGIGVVALVAAGGAVLTRSRRGG